MKYNIIETQYDWAKIRPSLEELQSIITITIRPGWQRHADGTTSWTGETPEGWVYASWSADPRAAMRAVVDDREVPSEPPHCNACCTDHEPWFFWSCSNYRKGRKPSTTPATNIGERAPSASRARKRSA